jgi:hypothetical protein
MSTAPDSATAPHTPRERATMLVNALVEKQPLAVSVREWMIGAIAATIDAACKESVADERATIRQLIDDLSPHHRTAWAWKLLALTTIDQRSEREGN